MQNDNYYKFNLLKLTCVTIIFMVIFSSTTMIATAILTPALVAQNTNSTLDHFKNPELKGEALVYSGKYHQSIPYFDQALAINPNDVTALISKGTALIYTGKANESITYFDKALTVNPNDIIALTRKGLALAWGEGKANESITYFDKALTVNPNDVYALTGKGLALVKLGKYNESISYYDKALAINPKFLIATKERAWVAAIAAHNTNSTNTNSTATKKP